MTALRKDAEHKLQCAVCDLLRLAAAPGLIWYSVPNDGSRSPRTGARMKARGMWPGVADLAFALPGGKAAFLELKSPQGRLSPEQRAFQDTCERAGVPYATANSLAAAESVLRLWGALSDRMHWQDRRAA